MKNTNLSLIVLSLSLLTLLLLALAGCGGGGGGDKTPSPSPSAQPTAQPTAAPTPVPLGAPKVVFQRTYSNGTSAICAMNPDGSNVRVLSDVAMEPNAIEPNVSADGKKIVFLGSAFKSPLMIMDSDGKNVRKITNDGLTYRGPSLSPDGTKIACTIFDVNDVPQLAIVNADGSGQRTVVAGYRALTPRWSPDGTKIVAAQSEPNLSLGTRYNIVKVNADGTNLEILAGGITSARGESVSSPSFSRDGQFIYFSRATGDGTSSLTKIAAAGGSPTVLSASGAVDYEPIIAPNGKLYYTKQPQGVGTNGEIYVYDPTTAITTTMNLTNSTESERYATFGGM
jgi:Tol biopolymer transport system component